MICEGGGKRKFDTFDDDEDENGENADPNKELAKGHGGCGNRQPVFRKEGLRLAAVTKPTASEVFVFFSFGDAFSMHKFDSCQMTLASENGRGTDKRSLVRRKSACDLQTDIGR